MTELTGRHDAPVLLLTKLHPPFVPAQAIARERLFERLREGRGRSLSLVACPAGVGKSTLLLWAHVFEALGSECPRLGIPAEAAAAAPLTEIVLPRLLNALVE